MSKIAIDIRPRAKKPWVRVDLFRIVYFGLISTELIISGVYNVYNGLSGQLFMSSIIYQGSNLKILKIFLGYGPKICI